MLFNEFIPHVYSLCEHGRSREAISAVLYYFDDHMSEDEFIRCDNVLKNIDTYSIDSSVIVACLAITYMGKDYLPSRPDFYKRSMRAVTKSNGWCYARSLLKKYR